MSFLLFILLVFLLIYKKLLYISKLVIIKVYKRAKIKLINFKAAFYKLYIIVKFYNFIPKSTSIKANYLIKYL